MTSQYFIGGMMPDLANPVQHPQTIIEIRPFRGGWQRFEDTGVGPYWVDEKAKEDAVAYAKAREIWPQRDSRAQRRRISGKRHQG
jgi:hypothetical protein